MFGFGLYGPITGSPMTFSGPQNEPNSRQKCQYEHSLERGPIGGPNRGPSTKKGTKVHSFCFVFN